MELLGEFVVEVSSSVKQSDMQRETMEKKYECSKSSSMSSRRFTTTTHKITSKEEVV